MKDLKLYFHSKGVSEAINSTKKRRQRLHGKVIALKNDVPTDVNLGSYIEESIVAMSRQIEKAMALHSMNSSGDSTVYHQPILLVNRYLDERNITLNNKGETPPSLLGAENDRLSLFNRMLPTLISKVILRQNTKDGNADTEFQMIGNVQNSVAVSDATTASGIPKASIATLVMPIAGHPKRRLPGTSPLAEADAISPITGGKVLLNFINVALHGELLPKASIGASPRITYYDETGAPVTGVTPRHAGLNTIFADIETYLNDNDNSPDVKRSAAPIFTIDVTSIYARFRDSGFLTEYEPSTLGNMIQEFDMGVVKTFPAFARIMRRDELQGFLDTAKRYHPTKVNIGGSYHYKNLNRYIDALIDAGIVTSSLEDNSSANPGDYLSGYRHGLVASVAYYQDAAIDSEAAALVAITGGTDDFDAAADGLWRLFVSPTAMASII